MKRVISLVLAAFLFINTILLITPNAFANVAGDYVAADHFSGTFNVPANQQSPVDFTNTTGQTVTITVNTEGTWGFSSELTKLDAEGPTADYLPYLTDSIQYLKYPDKKPFSLLAVKKGSNPPVVTQVGKQSQITLAPGETISFVANEIDPKYNPDVYTDNTGNISIKWSAPKPEPTKVVPPPVNPSKPSINLAGTWIGEGYTCGLTGLVKQPGERVQITINGNSIVATKITGDKCVPAGKTTFKGTLPSSLSNGSSFPVTYTTGTIFAPATSSAPSTLTIIDQNSFTTSGAFPIKFTRV
jgi:hypothetical protein